MTEDVKTLALRHLKRDATHISASILLHEETVDFLPWGDRYRGICPDIRGFMGLHCVASTGVAEIAIAMLGMKRWDLNGRDSNGPTPLVWDSKYGGWALANVLLEQEDVDPTLSDKHGLAPLAYAAKAGKEGVVKLLLERVEVNPNSSNISSTTALSHAARSRHMAVVKILLDRG